MATAKNLRRSLEALIFSCDEPATAALIRRAIPSLTPSRIPDLVAEINDELSRESRPYEIVPVAGGYRFRTRPDYADVLRAALPERRLRLSRAALETLAVVAYRQPVTRPELEDLRCVDCGGVLKSLLDRGLIQIAGRRDAPGRPVLYRTARRFLETFDLESLRDLPTLRDLSALDEGQPPPPSPGPELAFDPSDDPEPPNEPARSARAEA